jgi:hypothetical protein
MDIDELSFNFEEEAEDAEEFATMRLRAEHNRETDGIQQESTATDDFENRLHNARSRYMHCSSILQQNNLRKCGKLSQALELRRSYSGFVIFAINKPKPNAIARTLKYVKEYVVGSPPGVFRYAQALCRDVVLDEVVLAEIPIPLHFDIEIKKKECISTAWLVTVLRQNLEVIADGVFVGEGLVERLVDAYGAVVTKDWTEPQCRSGLEVVRNHITRLVEMMLPEDAFAGSLGMQVVTGCRANKFSLHVVMSRVFCDSQVLTMPLLVFEIARWFASANAMWLVRNEACWETAEGQFRLRALMLCDMADEVWGGDDSVFFKGYNDTPFDEAIYTANHLLRAPGACKESTAVPALAPVEEGGSMLVAGRSFERLFSFDDPGVARWAEHTVCCGCVAGAVSLQTRYLLTGWTPSEAYPVPRKWFGAKQRHAQAVGGYATSFTLVERVNVERYQERRRSATERRVLNARERQLVCGVDDMMEGRGVIKPEDVFRSESGERKKFKMFVSGEWLYHVHGQAEERSPSAKVFCGGFTCFGCSQTYGVLRTREVEEDYPFGGDEVVSSQDPDAYIAQVGKIDWVARLLKKFCVVDAPMGSGKTHEISGLVSVAHSNKKHVCVVSFRRTLALQQAKRMGISCYLDRTYEQLMSNDDDLLVICVNSLFKLGPMEYDYVVLDECGMIRRHFLSSITANVLGKVFDRFVRLIRGAKFVVMLQDGVSRDDVQFYTELDGVDCEDRSRVSALSFKKPVVIHPIKFSTEHDVALWQVVKSYRESIDGGTCLHPFMVFCSSVHYAEFLVETLKARARELGSDPERVRGMWGAIRTTSQFCRDFAADPNAHAARADVLVATSIIGVGFSISRHFQSFHAFLFNRILLHAEEQQFIRRLRFVMEGLPVDAVRQSYLYVERASGSSYEYTAVLSDFNKVRRVLLESALVSRRESVLCLEQTQARVRTERAMTFASHHQLWKDWGDRVVDSAFDEMSAVGDTEERKQLKKQFQKFASVRKLDIGDRVEGEVDEVGSTLSQVEVGAGMAIYRAGGASDVLDSLKTSFINEKLFLGLLHKKQPDDTRCRKVIGSKNAVAKLAVSARQLAAWVCYYFRSLGDEEIASVWIHLACKRYSTGVLYFTARLQLGQELLPRILAPLPGEPQLGYLKQRGSMPFFNGAVCVPDMSLCAFLKKELEPVPGDSTMQKKRKKDFGACCRVVLGDHKGTHVGQVKLYTDPSAAHSFVKKILDGLGLSLRTTRKRVNVGGEQVGSFHMDTSIWDVAMMFVLKKDTRDRVLMLLPLIMTSGNLNVFDREWVSDALVKYNEVVVENNLDENLGIVLASGSGRIVPLVGRRNAEWALEREAQTPDPPADHGRVLQVRDELAMLAAVVDGVLEEANAASHARALNDTARQTDADVDNGTEEEEEEEDNDDDDTPSFRHGGLVDDMADTA